MALVLRRHVGDEILIKVRDETLKLTIIDIKGTTVGLAFTGSQTFQIVRKELKEHVEEN